MGLFITIFISCLALTQSRVSSADLVGEAGDGAMTDAGNGAEHGVRNGAETDAPLSVLRPDATAAASTPFPVPCSEKPFEFPDLTTGSCASCFIICGAKRSEYCLKEPNCQGVDGSWNCSESSCDANCDSPTEIVGETVLYVGERKCSCVFGEDQKRNGGRDCEGTPPSKCTRDIDKECLELRGISRVSRIKTGVLVSFIVFILVAIIISLAWRKRERINAVIQKCLENRRLRNPGHPVPIDDPEVGNQNEPHNVHDPAFQ